MAHGLFTAGGKDVSPANGSTDTLYLEGGTLKLSHPDKDSHFTDHVNPTTCYVTFKIRGTYTFGHGTGKYKDYSGHGKYTVKEQGILARTKAGACNDQSAEPTVQAGFINASGPASKS